MLIDVSGRVQNTKLFIKNALMPLFEAIINSVDSIHSASMADGRISVRIDRERQVPLPGNIGGGPNAIEGFTITDNGVGFTEVNYNSFETMDSRAKFKSGGKGVGRLLWLIAFDHAEVESTYQENGKWYRRRFDFRRTLKGIENETHEQVETKALKQPSTTVRLFGFEEKYRVETLKTAEGIARRIVEHFLEYYLLGKMPTIILSDPGTKTILDLSNTYAQEFQGLAKVVNFHVGEHLLHLHTVLTRSHSDAQHRLRFCARNRIVESVALANRIPHLDSPIRNDSDEQVYYQGYVVGKLLDESVNSDRSAFNLEKDSSELALHGETTWEDVVSTAVSEARKSLEPYTNEARSRALARVATFVQGDGARYRPLLEHRKEQVQNLSTTMSDDKLDLELHKLNQSWRHEVRTEVTANLAALPEDPSQFEAFRESFQKSIGELQEVVKADLADYVLHRATVIKYLEKLIGARTNGIFENEDALHDFVFPRRKTSGEVDYDQHNLWVIDERLVYHQYLASELAFNRQAQAPVAVNSATRPDIIVYQERVFDEPMAFVVDANEAISAVSIVEFKKPQRTKYDEDENPIRQVIEYVQEIRGGRAKRPDDTYIERLPDTVPFYAHIVADLSPKFLAEIKMFGFFIPTPDNQGYIGYHPAEKCYIEILSYRKLLNDARKKNRAFFEQLQIVI